jgi:hypothetical protein
MIVLVIPRKEWVSFFKSFSRQHEGWRVTLEAIDYDTGALIEAREMALEGVSAELDGDGRIEIMVGERADEHVTHIIERPVEVRLEETDEGAHHALDIESETGSRTLLVFGSAMLHEMMDGVAV